MNERVHPFPGQVLRYARDLNGIYPEPDDREIVTDLNRANLVTSETVTSFGVVCHRPVLDVDFPAKLIPSSTPGHFHLYLDKPMSWERYERLLRALAEARILEQGYVDAAIQRRYTAVRLPWITKG